MSAGCSSFAFQLLFWGEGAVVGVSMVFWGSKQEREENRCLGNQDTEGEVHVPLPLPLTSLLVTCRFLLYWNQYMYSHWKRISHL